MFKNWKANNAKRKTLSGEIITIPRSKWGYVRNGKVCGKSIQDGEPTPDNPVEIKTVPSELGITSCGENLFKPFSQGQLTVGGVVCKVNADNSITLNGTATVISWFEFGFALQAWTSYREAVLFPLNRDKTYFVKVDIISDSDSYSFASQFDGIICGYATEEGAGEVRMVAEPFSASFSEGIFCDRAFIRYSAGSVFDNFTFRLCVSNGAPTTETYIGSTTPITLRDTEGNLHTPKSLPDGTRDEVDLDGGECVDKIAKRVLNGTESWALGTSGDNTLNQRFYLALNCIPNSRVICSHLKEVYPGNVGLISLDVQGCNISNGAFFQFKADKTIIGATVAEFKAWLSNNPITILYALATPIQWTLHPDEQKKIITVDSDTAYVYTNAEVQPTISANAISYGED